MQLLLESIVPQGISVVCRLVASFDARRLAAGEPVDDRAQQGPPETT